VNRGLSPFAQGAEQLCLLMQERANPEREREDDMIRESEREEKRNVEKRKPKNTPTHTK
jgi:hypothetical protein